MTHEPSDALFDALRADGTIDSHGALTIDPLRAREVLGHERLLRPEEWILEIVAAAVAAGATQLAIDGECGAWRATYDRATPLDGAPDLAEGWSDAGAASLVRGVAALLDQGRTVTVTVTEGGRSRAMRFEGGEQGTEESAAAGTSTRIEVSGGGPLEALTRLLPGTRPSLEEDVLRDRCAYAPLEIVVNGHPISRTVSATGFAARFLRDRSGAARLPLFLSQEAREVEGFSAVVALRLPAEGEPPGFRGWSVTVNGVRFPLEDAPWRHVHCLAAATTVSLDLSGAAVRRDEKLEALLATLRAEALELVLQAARDVQGMSRLGKDALLRLLETILDAEKPYTERRDHPILHRLVACRAVICALHGDPLVGSGVNTIRVLSKLPGYGRAEDVALVDFACRALGRMYLSGCHGDGDGYPLSAVGDDEEQRAELFELWRRLAPSHACRRAHLRLALDAVVRERLDEATAFAQQAEGLGAGPDGWTRLVSEWVKRACGEAPRKVDGGSGDDLLEALCALADADMSAALGDRQQADALYARAATALAGRRTWWDRVWREAALAGEASASPAEAAVAHLRRLALEGPRITLDEE